MRAITRTTNLFIATLNDALPGVTVNVVRSVRPHGRSNYLYIHGLFANTVKVRISDHAIGMRRALSGECSLYIPAGAKPDSWAVWVGDLCKHVSRKREAA